MSFAPSDLHISQDEQDKITAALANAIVTDPIQNTIEEEVQTVADYTTRYTLPGQRQQRLVRALVLHKLYSLLGDVSKARADDFENAMQELKDIRDGKFPELAQSGSAAAVGAWGSQTRLKMPSGS